MQAEQIFNMDLKKACVPYLLVFFLSLLVYAQTLSFDFVWDDQIVVTQNTTTIQGIGGLSDIWSSFTYLEGRKIYRPVPQTIHAILWEFFPENPLVFHLTSILLYSLCCLSVLYLLLTFFKTYPPWLLTLIALVFVLLPVHTEVVANVKSIDEILGLTFVCLSLSLATRKSTRAKSLSLILLGLAVLSKLSAITIIPFWVLLVFHEHFQIVWNKLRLSLNKVDINAVIAGFLILLSLFLYLNNYKTYFIVLALYLASPFILFIKSRHLRFAVFIGACVLFSIHLRWEFSLLLFILLFYLDLKEEKYSKIELALKLLVFVVITSVLDYNSGIYFIPFAGLFYFYFLFQNNNSYAIKYAKPLLIVLFLFSLFISFTYEEAAFNPNLLFVCALSYFITIGQERSFKLKLFVLLISVPIAEYNFFQADYAQVFQTNALSEELESTDEKTLNAISPYHNILILAEDDWEKTATIARIQLIYLQKAIFPTALVHQHGTWQIKMASWKDWDVYLSVLLHLLLLLLAYYFYRKKVYLPMWGILWYFFTISIYTNILRLMPDTLAERFLFMPSLGFSITLIGGLYFLINKWHSNERKALLTLVIVLLPLLGYYGYKTIDRSKDWQNNYTLAANTLPHARNNAAINAQYALELNNLMKYGQIQNSDSAQQLVVKHYKKAIDIFPEFYGPNADLAAYYIKEAQPDSAFPYLLESTRLEPEQWLHHYYLALIYFERNNYQEALVYFDKIIANETLQSRAGEFPELLEAYEFGARCLHNTGRDQEAYAYLKESIQLFNSKSSYVLLGNLYRVTGKTNLAIATFEQLLTLYPADQEIVNTIDYLKQGLIY